MITTKCDACGKELDSGAVSCSECDRPDPSSLEEAKKAPTTKTSQEKWAKWFLFGIACAMGIVFVSAASFSAGFYLGVEFGLKKGYERGTADFAVQLREAVNPGSQPQR